MFGRKKKAEERAATQNSAEFLRILGLENYGSASGETVTIESALGVPAVWAAVNFVPSTLAGLPLKAYRRVNGQPEEDAALSSVLNKFANEELSSFEWLKWKLEQTFTGGRGVTFIERNARGEIINLWPLEPARLTIRRVNGRKVYDYRQETGSVRYEASEVLDLPFMLGPDLLSHRSPIMANREVIGLAQAVTKYGASYFRNGGVPPFAITGNFQSPGAMGRAANDLDEAVRKAAKETRQALVLPSGLEIKSIGADAEKAQMIETQRFVVEQIARIYSLPPVFLQDLTHGTYSNTEQQDLHFVKHTVKRWAEQIEQEINLKFFGRGSDMWAEFNMDGLLRGDFKTRMEGYAQAVQNAILTPDEVRRLENRPEMAGGDRLYIQGATVPLEQSGQIGDQNDNTVV